MGLKPRPNHAMYLRTLRAMGPEPRARKVFELSEFSKRLFLDGLRRRFPEMSDAQLHRLALDRLAKCHNRNY